MHVLIATEIWGRTPHIEKLAETLAPVADDVTVVDPYAGADPGFRSEDAAYAAYVERCGLTEYARRVRRELLTLARPVFLVGFSAGAGAVWSVICGQKTGLAHHAACFYGSAIRTMTDLTPNIPVDAIFPRHEPHFDVTALTDELRTRPMVHCIEVDQRHGFMNPLSVNYDKDASRRWTDWLKWKIDSTAG